MNAWERHTLVKETSRNVLKCQIHQLFLEGHISHTEGNRNFRTPLEKLLICKKFLKKSLSFTVLLPTLMAKDWQQEQSYVLKVYDRAKPNGEKGRLHILLLSSKKWWRSSLTPHDTTRWPFYIYQSNSLHAKVALASVIEVHCKISLQHSNGRYW